MRLGFAVKVLGQPNLKSHDSRRWQNNPHLSVSLAYVRDIFLYLERQGITMYRLSSELAPYVAHPGLPQFHNQVDECLQELEAVGQMAQRQGLRLSFHPPSYVNLSSPDETLASRGTRWLTTLARILDAMGAGPEGVVVVHIGGAYGNKRLALERFALRWEKLPELTRRRLALENDDSRFSVADIGWVHKRTGIPLVFDYLHFLNNPDGMELTEALAKCLQSWPEGVRPKIHFSSPRTAMKLVKLSDTASGQVRRKARPPQTTEHADFINPFEFIAFCKMAKNAGLGDFDVMLEAKAKDLALLRLRDDLRKFAPEEFDGI
ncbi:MAG TPA: UV DNA damage repair endonuclease UvsE [Chloroflexi bacterium]|nr:UV DNA damage repair endonuclease UvsE [Chloroflexota bacterium]